MGSAIKTIRDVFHEMQKKSHPSWNGYGIQHPQSLLNHSRAVRDQSRELAARYLTRNRAEISAMLGSAHDIVMGIVPEIKKDSGISRMQKQMLNLIAINHIGSLSQGGNRIRNLWLCYNEQDTASARYVRDIDQLQQATQALDYEKRNSSRYNLQPFWDRARKELSNSSLIEELTKLEMIRPSSAREKPFLVNEVDKLEATRLLPASESPFFPLPERSSRNFEDLRDIVMMKVGRGSQLRM